MAVPSRDKIPMTPGIPHKPVAVVLAAVLCAAGVWLYVSRVLIPYQIADAAAHDTPRGNLSDLYPRWFGAQELLLRGQNPYSLEVTRRIQTGFYGRPLDPDLPGGQKYQQGFYYPVYISFILAPTIHLPFASVQKGFLWILFGLTLATIPLWLLAVRWSPPVWVQVSLVVCTIGSLPVVQGLKLQQITLFVVPLLAVALLLLASHHHIPAGILLALATIKPQLVWLLLFWLMIWTLADWRHRYRWAVSFLVSMAILCAASELYLPHWIARFWQAAREYHNYTGEMSALDELIGAPWLGIPWSRAVEVFAFGMMTGACWRERGQAANAGGFTFMFSLVLATTNLLVPSFGPYNQVLLIPALLLMLRERRAIWHRSRASRALSVITIGLIAWPWISCIALAGLSFILSPEMVERGWAVPFWTALQIPVAVSALMLLEYYQRTFATPPRPGSS